MWRPLVITGLLARPRLGAPDKLMTPQFEVLSQSGSGARDWTPQPTCPRRGSCFIACSEKGCGASSTLRPRSLQVWADLALACRLK